MIKKNKFELIIYILLIVIMIGLPFIKLLSYILYLNGTIADSFLINEVYLLWGTIPLLFGTYLFGIITQRIKFNYIDTLIIILIFLGIISSIFAINKTLSILGESKRNEGLLSLLSYYLIFLNIKNIGNEKYKHNIIKIFIILGLFQVIYSILQVYTNFAYIKHYTRSYMAMGLCGNPNFLGSYMVMLTLFTSTYYLLENKYLFLTMLFFIGICLAQSTGPLLGFIIAFIFLIIYYFKKIKKKKLIIIILVFISLFYTVDYSTKYVQTGIFNNEVDSDYNINDEIKESLTTKKTKERIANGRIELWLDLLPYSKNYWLTGTGLDSIRLIYPQNGRDLVYDKAHNIYLQTLLTNGLFALLTYLLLCLIIFIKGLKFKDTFYIGLYLSFIGYSIQGFANISVIDVAPYFFIILGLLSFNIKVNEKA